MSKKSSGSKTPMTKEAAQRIHSAEATKNGGQVSKQDFTARAQRAAERNSKE